MLRMDCIPELGLYVPRINPGGGSRALANAVGGG